MFPGKTGQTLKPIVLTSSFCHALTMVSHIFGQSWDVFVVGELRLLLREPTPPEGTRLKGILTTLIRQAALSNPGLAERFIIQTNQIRFKTADRRYTVVILQGDGDTVLLSWQMSTRAAGSSFISYVIKGTTWTCTGWDVSEECQQDLRLLSKVGGEVLGFLAEHDLLPKDSFFIKALEAQIGDIAAMRERATAAPGE